MISAHSSMHQFTMANYEIYTLDDL